MWRACACAECGEGACPVHSAGRWLAALPVGAAPWAAASPAQMRRALRAALSAASVADAEAFGSHDLRRGRARDLLLGGKSLEEIAALGEWCSLMVIFKHYTHFPAVQQEVALSEHLAESGSDSDAPAMDGNV